jgi:hypothetical protein
MIAFIYANQLKKNNITKKGWQSNSATLSHFSLWHKVGDMVCVPTGDENLSGR